MAKLVVLTEGIAGRTHDLKVEKTTIGRVEDNVFQVAEPSVSSHHCEVILRGDELVVKDLDSTNGSYINGERITEAVWKPGQVLRLGQVEIRLETDATTSAAKKTTGPTIATQRGVSLSDLESGSKTGSIDTISKGFSKKDDRAGKIFWIAAIAVGVVIVFFLVYALMNIR